MTDAGPAPLHAEDLAGFFAETARGTAYREALEHLLVELPLERAELLMQILRESRGAWHPFLHGRGGRALFIGNAFSGTQPALLNAGYELTVYDTQPARLDFARVRNDAHLAGKTECVGAADGRRLPFDDGAFDLVVQEDGLPAQSGFGHDAAECRRVSRGEVWLSADNRLGYKRSSGRRHDFRVPSPAQFLREAVRPPRGERTLVGYRRALRAPGAATRAYALYPHARDFASVVAIDDEAPRLYIGPNERKNRLKLVGRALGLFPVLAPSFGILSTRSTEPSRAQRMLHELASHLRVETPRLEHAFASRGNAAVILTRGVDERGDWVLHLPLNTKAHHHLERHLTFSRLAKDRGLPTSRVLYQGLCQGVWLSCEQRFDGLTAPQLCGVHAATRNLYADVAREFARLVVRPAEPLDEATFDELVGAKFERVAEKATAPETLRQLDELLPRAREGLLGRAMPLVLYHSDLRAKHVQLRADGRVRAFLDWGSAEERDLPLFDLLHLLVHERKQEAGLDTRTAWRLVAQGELRDFEHRLLADYGERVGLDPQAARVLAGIYPVLVGAVAERHWDYSRPRWIRRNFGDLL